MSNQVIRALLQRWAKLQAEYDQLIGQPESYNINGSVSATNRKLDDLQKQIDIINQQLNQLTTGSGIKRTYPTYR